MRSLVEYLFESSNYIVDNLVIKYDCPADLYISAPKRYTESDISTYLDDTVLTKLPAANAKKFFGINEKHITDAYFEYDSMTASMGKDQAIDIEWDGKYDSSVKSTDELQTYQIKNLKYVIEFEYFEFDSSINNDNVQDTLNNLMQTTVSNSQNKYPISISLNNSNIEYETRE